MISSVIILGDPHVGKGQNIGKTGLGATLNSRIADQFYLLDWTLEQALEQGSSHIFITGDCFEDTKPHPTLIALFISWLKKCQAHNVHVHIVLGNHDMIRAGSVFTSSLDIISEIDLDNVSVYKNIYTVFIDNTAFTMLPFRDRKSFSVSSNQDALQLIADSLGYELASIPSHYKKVVIGHLAIQGSIPVGDEIDDMTNELFCPMEMFTGYDYVWMGHVHAPQVMHKQHPYVAHIGSMDISNFGETNQKKHIVIVDCNSDSFTEQTLPTRALKKISIIIPKDTDNTTEYVLQELQKTDNYDQSIVRVEISLASPELIPVNKAEIEAYLTQQGVFNITGISETKKTTVIKRQASANIDSKMDTPTAIRAYADKHIEAEQRDSFIELSMEIYHQYKQDEK